MAGLVLSVYQLLDKLSLLLSSYILIELLTVYNGVEQVVGSSFLKTIAVLMPIAWYVYLFINRFFSRKIRKKNEQLEHENIKLENEKIKELLEQIKKGNIKELVEELEEKQEELNNNKKHE